MRIPLRRQEDPDFEEDGSPSKFQRASKVYEHKDEEAYRVEDAEQFEELQWNDGEDWDLVVSNEDAGTPDLPPEELQELDREALLVEMERLETTAIRRTKIKDMEADGIASDMKWLTTKFVFDWRYRDGTWKRRARLVAREFKTGSLRNDILSPATSSSIIRIIPLLAIQGKMRLWSIDVKDAFLQVPQKVRCACRMPPEFQELSLPVRKMRRP